MKKTVFIFAMALLAIPTYAQKKKKDKEKDEGITIQETAPPVFILQNQADSISYAIGFTSAANIKNQNIEGLNIDILMQAMKDYFTSTGKMSETDARNALQQYNNLKEQKENEANRQKGIQFLEENKKKEGVVTLPSGLQYKVLVKGTGTQKPLLTDRIKAHYHGTLIDGTVFDSSVNRGKPASFPVSGVIRGWVEALQLMNVGDKWELYIPYELAYDNRKVGNFIKPYSALVFQVELLEIEK